LIRLALALELELCGWGFDCKNVEELQRGFMHRIDGMRTGGEILVDQLAIHGVRHVFLRAGRKLSCCA
jgi:hypothetical protein